ncbi:hypothetical protein [Tautonia plasticadhaerens]|uniref:Uncharacterized protein n=1 Tax=Tautonia plasticadhaerens TaxID=2527974 RepID=A0A518H641_9BACT|nr:hypothetical protein [Tautonia plasticadhaerens]QDV36307.1 hypothetical protein ElP_42270 [Tautonia plasticadhaerens]
MLDRASTFAEPIIVDLLKTRFVPVAIDQAYQRRQDDAEGDFYRRIAAQGPRDDFEDTTQGFYIATAGGDLLLYNNNRDPAKLRRLMTQKLAEFEASPAAGRAVEAISSDEADPRYNVEPPVGGLVLRVRAKVLGGYGPTDDPWRRIFQESVSRDNLWVTAAEHEALARGEVPEPLRRRIARFHLIDNTRGEPPMWEEGEIRSIELRLRDGRLEGSVHLETNRGDRGYEAELLGVVEVEGGWVVRLELVALGEFWGAGPFTGGAPEGRFPLAVTFEIADGTDVADRIPPQGSRGWLDGYLR